MADKDAQAVRPAKRKVNDSSALTMYLSEFRFVECKAGRSLPRRGKVSSLVSIFSFTYHVVCQRPQISRPAPTAESVKDEKKAKCRRRHKEPSTENWPDYTDITTGGLRDQSILIRALCRDAIHILELTLVTQEAWPELHRAAEYRVEVFSEAAKALQKTDIRYRDLRKRIAQDEEYASSIGAWVIIFVVVAHFKY